MVVVKIKKGENTDRIIARFKKKVLDAGLLQEVRDRQRHKTASEKRKEDKARIKHSINIKKKRNF